MTEQKEEMWRHDRRRNHMMLEDQMCSYTGMSGEESPDLLDACVYALTDLMIVERESGGVLMDISNQLNALPANSWEEAAGSIDWY